MNLFYAMCSNFSIVIASVLLGVGVGMGTPNEFQYLAGVVVGVLSLIGFFIADSLYEIYMCVQLYMDIMFGDDIGEEE
jgi:hypothetical protein